MEKRKARILVVDDHPPLREEMSRLINFEADLGVSHEAGTAEQALELIDSAEIDLAIVDISLPGMSGIELVRNIRAKRRSLPILVLSMHEESHYGERAMRAGAMGYVSKSEASERVVPALRELLSGGTYVSEKLGARLGIGKALHQPRKDAPSRAAANGPPGGRPSHSGYWSFDVASESVEVSPGILRIFGLDPAGAPPALARFLEYLHDADRPDFLGKFNAACEGGPGFDSDVRTIVSGRAAQWIRVVCERLMNDDGVARLHGTMTDVTSLKDSERALAGEIRILEAIAGSAPLNEILDLLCRDVESQSGEALCSVLLLDEGRLQVGAAPSLGAAFSAGAGGIPIGDPGWDAKVIGVGEKLIVPDIAASTLEGEFRDYALGQGILACWGLPVRGRDGTVLGVFATYYKTARGPTEYEERLGERAERLVRIAIENSRARARIQRLAHFDELTGLPNRVAFMERLERAIESSRQTGASFAVMAFGLDRFKNINETLGHETGDEVLAAVARRLRNCVSDPASLARLGGNRFAVLVEGVTPELHALDAAKHRIEAGESPSSTRDPAQIAGAIADTLARPLLARGAELYLTTSIGISTYPDDSRDARALLRNANIAMYRAKELGGSSHQRYSERMDLYSIRRLELESSLRGALDRDELLVHYQPKVELASGRIVGMEALVRWRHPKYGWVSPMEFIPIAEENGLIMPIGRWVLRHACAQNRMWQAAGLPKVRVAVNFSARQFMHQNLVEDVAAVLRETGLDASSLEVEITESVVMHDTERAARTLQQLKAMGVSISIDDFGTGYSSLAYLRRFPIDSVKVDRSFILETPGNSDAAAIAQAIIAMAQSLRLGVIAEGVETAEQVEFLEFFGCEQAQGHLFGKPLGAPEFSRLLRLRGAGNTDPTAAPWWNSSPQEERVV